MHIFVSALFLLLSLVSANERTIVSKGVSPEAFQNASPNVNATNYFPLSLSIGTSALLAPDSLQLTGQSWYTNVKIGAGTFPLILDTGSSDIWVAETGFQCLSQSTGLPVPESQCLFGPTYSPGKEFKPISSENFNIQYGDGDFLTGSFGNTKVTLGGISVKQQLTVINTAGWNGDGISSGVVGFAYPSITSAFSGANPSADGPNLQVPYDPLFTTMYRSGKIPPVFSVALSRGSPNRPDGYLALGGLAPVVAYGFWASSKIQYVQLGSGYINGTLPYPQYQFYTITPDAFIYEGSETTVYEAENWSPLPNPSGSSQIQTILDSGTTLIYLPTNISNAVNALFSPPGVWNDDIVAYSVDCNAIAPAFAVKIGGVVFSVDKRDMIMDDGTGQGTCQGGVSDGGTYAPYVLGDVFMKNVMVVFDVGASELRFRSRGYY